MREPRTPSLSVSAPGIAVLARGVTDPVDLQEMFVNHVNILAIENGLLRKLLPIVIGSLLCTTGSSFL